MHLKSKHFNLKPISVNGLQLHVHVNVFDRKNDLDTEIY